jgi:DNA gyrase subunit A
LDEDDELGWVKMTNGSNEVIVVSRLGQAIRFAEKDVRPMGRTAAGVSAMKLLGNDEIRGIDVIEANAQLLIVTEKGYAKRTPLEEYSLQRRNGKGVRTVSPNSRATIGTIVAARVASDQGDITLISRDGIMLRIPINTVSSQSRVTQGVRVMKMRPGDIVASVAILDPKTTTNPAPTE